MKINEIKRAKHVEITEIFIEAFKFINWHYYDHKMTKAIYQRQSSTF